MFGQKSKPGTSHPGRDSAIPAPFASSARVPSPSHASYGRRFGPPASAEKRPENNAERGRAEGGDEPVPFEPRRDEKRLIVGKGIVLKGEVSACNRLVVEGRVEASLKDSDVMVIAEGGEYRGTAEINEADISGHVDGTLTVRTRLLVRATGRVTGDIRYGELEVERGGRVSGDVQAANEPRTREASREKKAASHAS